MLYIKIIGMQRDTNFAPPCIPLSRKNYLPTGGKSFNTHIQGLCRITGKFNGDLLHTFNGTYQADKVTNQLAKSLKRDLIALKNLHAGKVRVIIGKGEIELFNDCLPLVSIDCTNKRIKNTILNLIHINKTF